jgi:DNA polymerase-3 subunit epsilon
MILSDFFQLTRPLFVFDTETTGTNVETDRVIEIGFQKWTANGLEQEWRSLINPCVHIPEEVTKIHGITDLMVQGCRSCNRTRGDHLEPPVGTIGDPTRECEGFRPWPMFRQIAANFAKGFSDCDFAGKRIRFDLRIFGAEMARAGVEWSFKSARVVDIDRLEALVQPRNLSALHEKYTGAPHEGAHGALSDVRASTTVIVAQLDVHKALLPRDLDQLHLLQWPGWIDTEGKFSFNDDGVPFFTSWSKFSNKPMREADVGFWDWIITHDFSAEIKKIAADAKLGKYPVRA